MPFEATEFRETGKVFIPQGCYSRACKLHVAFHACESNSDQLAWYAQYNELAASNDMIVLYPDSYCHNGAGIIDTEKMLTNQGLYDKAFIAMIERLTSYQR
jgi:poly(3-hydroxybutyrate) depolymerase